MGPKDSQRYNKAKREASFYKIATKVQIPVEFAKQAN